MTAIFPHADLDAQVVFDRYHAAWMSMDPDRIADLHSAQATFWLQDGSPRLQGRETLRAHYRQLFQRYARLDWDIHRTLLGERHWVFEYDLIVTVTSAAGAPLHGRVSMADIVEFDDAGLVTRKDVFMDAAQAQALLTGARDPS